MNRKKSQKIDRKKLQIYLNYDCLVDINQFENGAPESALNKYIN